MSKRRSGSCITNLVAKELYIEAVEAKLGGLVSVIEPRVRSLLPTLIGGVEVVLVHCKYPMELKVL